ncbi:unnamed protein product [Prorocentrum cordatum]|uniref:Uncharacterized protein n=1 Tax=Prorocentrum cordatum TaxID=2364126 RepID=A0ABN9WWA9_9DINO|nr:unnamed protein product [Polarella glacialis]
MQRRQALHMLTSARCSCFFPLSSGLGRMENTNAAAAVGPPSPTRAGWNKNAPPTSSNSSTRPEPVDKPPKGRPTAATDLLASRAARSCAVPLAGMPLLSMPCHDGRHPATAASEARSPQTLGPCAAPSSMAQRLRPQCEAFGSHVGGQEEEEEEEEEEGRGHSGMACRRITNHRAASSHASGSRGRLVPCSTGPSPVPPLGRRSLVGSLEKESFDEESSE